MSKGVELTKLDISDVRRHAEHAKDYYQRLSEAMSQVCQASDDGNGRGELDVLIQEAGRKHAECGADIKAIMRLVK